MKSSELRALSHVELEEKLETTTRKLYELRVRATTKELENVSEITKERRNLARIKQVLAQKKREEPASEANA